jgi:hypothetical protein
MSTRKTPGGEGGRCVRVTTLPPHSAESREDPGALTSWNPKSHFRLVVEEKRKRKKREREKAIHGKFCELLIQNSCG